MEKLKNKIVFYRQQLFKTYGEFLEHIKNINFNAFSAEDILAWHELITQLKSSSFTCNQLAESFEDLEKRFPMTYEDAFKIVKAKQEKEAEEQLKKLD